MTTLGRGIPDGLNRVAPVVGLVAVAALGGVAVAASQPLFLLPALLLLALAGLSSFGAVPKSALLVWVALGPALFPFVRYPVTSKSIVTFDRVWVLGLGLLSFAAITDLSSASRYTRSAIHWFAALSLVVLGRALLGSAAGNSGSTIWVDAFLIPLVVLLLVRSAVDTREYADRILLALGVGGAIAALLAVAETVMGFSLATYSGGLARADLEAGVVRAAGPYDVPEVFVAVVLTTLAATLCWALRRGQRSYPVAGVLIFIQVSGIFLSYFRTGWAAALLLIVGSLAIRKGRSQRGVAIAIVALALVAVLGGQIAQSDQAVSTRLNNSNNTYGRIAAYQQGLMIVEGSPLVGVGVGGYHTTAESMAPVWFNGVRGVTYPHNTFLQILAEAGILGLITLLGCGWAIVRLLRRFWGRAAEVPDQHLALGGMLACSAYVLYGLPLAMIEYGAPSMALFTILGVCFARFDQLELASPTGGGANGY